MLSLRYFDLQISRYEDFATQSNNNRVLVRPLPPARGLIYDRKGELIADNRPSYDLTIVPERSDNIEQLLSELGKLIPFPNVTSSVFARSYPADVLSSRPHCMSI